MAIYYSCVGIIGVGRFCAIPKVTSQNSENALSGSMLFYAHRSLNKLMSSSFCRTVSSFRYFSAASATYFFSSASSLALLVSSNLCFSLCSSSFARPINNSTVIGSLPSLIYFTSRLVCLVCIETSVYESNKPILRGISWRIWLPTDTIDFKSPLSS
jgi:hypothetical protein